MAQQLFKAGAANLPDFLTVRMSRYKALEAIRILATALKDDSQEVQLSFAGSLVVIENDSETEPQDNSGG